jgi:hypothetical protein
MNLIRRTLRFNYRRLLYAAILFLLFIINPLTVRPAYTQSGVLLHYWNFNTSADLLTATYTMGGGSISINLEGTAAFQADTGQSFFAENARNGDTAGSHLRMNNPLTATLTFRIPTTGYKNVQVKYETRRSGQGAGIQEISYTTDANIYQAFTTITVLDATPVLQTLDFSGVQAVNENANFGIQIRFLQGLGGTAGNNRFDNVTVEGEVTGMPQVTHPIELQESVENAVPFAIDLNQVFSDPDNDKLTFTAESAKPDIAGIVFESEPGILKVHPKQRGDAWITVSAGDGHTPPVSTRFRVLVYPDASVLNNGFYAFTEWDPGQPESVYPPHTLFLQSDVNDPGLNAPLLYPYFISPDEYSVEDAANIGFPYKNTKRTRINGLGREGISFINTGRGRDLGGVLVALNTQNITTGFIDWLGGTILFNEREYAIRLQYRVGFTGEFRDVMVAGQPVEYLRNEVAGHFSNLSRIPLPEDASNQEYVQFLWRYYFISGSSGTRPQLQLDNILVHAGSAAVIVIEKTGRGSGSVTSTPDGVNCGSTCLAQFTVGTQVTLHAAALDPDSVFLGWTGSCAGQGPTCTFTIGQSGVVAAIFEPVHRLYLPFIPHPASIVINEFMASNNSTSADEDGDYSDWIEIYNRGSTVVSLYGIGLSDSVDPFRWTFPNITLNPGQYLLVWASGKNRILPGAPLHTNFSISAAGELLRLTYPNGKPIDAVEPITLPQDISYGLKPDGESGWYFFDHPTPGTANTSIGYKELLAPPTFSQVGGFYAEGFNLSLTATDPDVTILYTMDGSIPDSNNLNGATYFYKNQYPQKPADPFGEKLTSVYRSYIYNQPISIVNRANEPDKLTHISTTFDKDPGYYFPSNPVFKGTVIRARTIKPGAMPSAVQTRTFFVTPQTNTRYSLPVISLSIQEDMLFDYNIGIYVAGTVFDEWRAKNPGLFVHMFVPANYFRETREWEYPAHMELFEASQVQPVLSQDIGFRVTGKGSRSLPRKSLTLYARDEYGVSQFNYPIFPKLPYNNYKRLILRNSGQDEDRTNFRDALIQTVVSNLRADTQAYRPAALFINGEYWGIHNIRQHYDKYYLNQVYGVDPENIDYLSRDSVVEEGDAQHYQDTLNYIKTNGLQNDQNYQYIQTRIDVDNFMDYQIANIYAANTDWPSNNLDFWRLRTSEYNPQSPYGQDGRWRWLIFDTDLGFGFFIDNFTHNTLKFATMTGGPAYPNPDWATFLLRSFLENENFKVDFINRFADLMNTTFLPERVTGIIASMKQVIEPEMPEHIARWSRPLNMDIWNNNVNVMVNFANQRPAYQRLHIRQQFGIESDVNVTLNVSNPNLGYIRINTLDITANTPGVSEKPYPWKGVYFKGIPIQVTAVPRPGYKFMGWVEYPEQTSATFKMLPTDGMTLTARFETRIYLPTVTLNTSR